MVIPSSIFDIREATSDLLMTSTISKLETRDQGQEQEQEQEQQKQEQEQEQQEQEQQEQEQEPSGRRQRR